MFNTKSMMTVFCLTVVFAAAGMGGELKDDWSDFLHYTKIGRVDLAVSFGRAILNSQPDPADLVDLAVANPRGYEVVCKINQKQANAELASVTEQIIALVDQGRYVKRKDPRLVVEEVKRLNTTERGRLAAIKRLKDSGEFSIPFLLDVLADPTRSSEFANVIWALPQIGQPAIRPLGVAIQSPNPQVRSEVIAALGNISYPQGLAYLKYIVENDSSTQMKDMAMASINKIDPSVMGVSAAELFFQLAEKYYYHHDSLSPTSKNGMSNVWFWDEESQRLVWQEVDSRYFNELMAMRSCEWALKADSGYGKAVGLWLASYFKAEAVGEPMPAYFGEGHANAYVYGTSAGPAYLHQALARGLDENNAAVALAATEALIVTAGEQSIFAGGIEQPMLKALTFNDPAVRTSASIAVAMAGPRGTLTEGLAVVQNLATAISAGIAATASPEEQIYALRSLKALLAAGQQRNSALDLDNALEATVRAAASSDLDIRMSAVQVLGYMNSPLAQKAIATVALDENLGLESRITAFESLTTSGKLSNNMLVDGVLQQIYDVISDESADADLRSAASTAFGALNLPSENVMSLILDQAKS